MDMIPDSIAKLSSFAHPTLLWNGQPYCGTGILPWNGHLAR
ncbi:hypothetical protein [Moorena sp. SIO4G3]|nr:hypothetical protein [Moorena sp. SIO4G3]